MSNDQINERELTVILRELKNVLDTVNGDVVEFGCYKGETSVLIGQAIGKTSSRRLYLYDSFEGLPEKSREDNSPAGEQFRAGELPAGKGEVLRRFKQASLPLPVVKKAWFSDLTTNDVPESVAFAFLDGDFYESIRDSLKLIWPHLSKGAVVVVDDYQNEALPGVTRAVDGWLKNHPARLRNEASLAVICPRQLES
jgi:O-methyltransferase